MQASAGLPDMLHKTLLGCGILAALLYGGTDIVAGLLTRGYRFDTQSASALSALGATTRPLVLPLNLAAGVLMLAFAAGAWRSADSNWALRVMACLLAGNALFSMVAVAFFAPHLSEAADTPANSMYVILMAASVVLFVGVIGFGAIANRNWFRYFSIGVLLLFAAGFILALLLSKTAPGRQPGSLLGAQQRTVIYSELLWLALQAAVLLRA